MNDKLVTNLLHELEPVVEENLERHLKITKNWNPHDYVPWSEGRDFAFLGGEDWAPEQSRLDDEAGRQAGPAGGREEQRLRLGDQHQGHRTGGGGGVQRQQVAGGGRHAGLGGLRAVASVPGPKRPREQP